MLIVGHRGAPAHAPENTLKSFAKAVQLGARALEFDVRTCKTDGAIAVIHDSTLERTTNGKGRVKRATIEQLAALDAGEGEKVPLLEEVFEAFATRVTLFIEVKAREVAPSVAAMVTEWVLAGKAKYEDFVVICFYPDVLQTVKEFNREILVGANIEALENFSESARDGVFRLSKTQVAHDMEEILNSASLDYVNLNIQLLTPEVAKVVKANKAKLYCWTVNDEAGFQRAKDCGIDGVMTDDAGKAKAFFA